MYKQNKTAAKECLADRSLAMLWLGNSIILASSDVKNNSSVWCISFEKYYRTF